MISTNALGPAIAEYVAAHFGWATVFAGTVGAAILSAVLTLFIPERRKARSRETPTSMRQVIRRPGLRRILLVAVMVGLTLGALFTFYQPGALVCGFEQVSSFLIAFAGCAMVVRIGLGGLADRPGRLRVAQVALLLYVAAPFSIIWLDLFGLFLTGGLLGLVHGIFFPALNAVAIDHALENERGKAMAAYHGALNVGLAAGSYLLGYLAMATDYPTIFLVSGASCFAAFVLLATTPKISPKDTV
jgi:predicted MFS family arabinose efflux permease